MSDTEYPSIEFLKECIKFLRLLERTMFSCNIENKSLDLKYLSKTIKLLEDYLKLR